MRTKVPKLREPAILERLGSVGPKWESQTEDGLSRETREQSSAKFRTSVSVGRPLCVGRPTRSGSTDLGVGNTKLGKSKKNFGEKGLKQRKEVVDPLGEQHVPGSKPTNSHKNQQETRFWVWLFLVGIFELGQEQSKNRLESRGETLQIVATVLLIPTDVGQA